MFRPLTTPPPTRPRRGAILVVVLALLALLAVIALAFVFYADSEAQSARLFRQAQSGGGPGGTALPIADYDLAADGFIGSFVFGTNNLLDDVRGHDIMGTLYGGFAADVSPSVPFDGVGLTHDQISAQFGATSVPLGDRAHIVKHSATIFGSETVLIDPHWTGRRAVTAGTNLGPAPTRAAPLGRQYVPKNAGYTYPDLNNFYLASLAPTSGQVLVPSFYRPWHFNQGNVNTGNSPPTPNFGYRLAAWNPSDTNPATNTAQNTDWVTPEGRLRTLRPRPVDQLTPAEFAAVPPAQGGPLPYPIAPGLGNYTPAQRVSLYNLIDSKIKAGAIIGYPPADALPAGAPAGSVATTGGDVRNLLGGLGGNDSIWIDFGHLPKQWNGKWVKPLVAALVLDQDGLLNLNIYGNVRGGASPAHRSSPHGFGPWEVNLNPILGAGGANEGDNIVRGRLGTSGTPPVARRDPFGSPPAAQRLPFDRTGAKIPAYSLVNWDAGGTNPVFQLPAFPAANNPFATSPTYGGTGYYDDNDPADPLGKAARHPGLFTPNDWGRAADPTAASASPFTFPLSDLRRLRLRFAAPREEYEAGDFGRRPQTPVNERPQTTLVANRPAGPGYRLDPAHPNRLLTTVLSAGFDAPGLMPNYDIIDPTQSLQLPTGAGIVHAFHGPAGYPAAFPGVPTPGTHPSDLPQPPAGTTKFEFRNARAALGPIDLNRQLADYRALNAAPNVDGGGNPTPQPLSSTNMGNEFQARMDRQMLARDIFARLVVATGAQAQVFTQPTMVGPLTYQAGDVFVDPTTTPAGSPGFNALRYLAQLAANAVDFTDNDDVSTPFVWNPQNPADPQNAANYAAAELPNRVVFGVEKPRLVLNEVYSEITNDPNEKTDDSMAVGASPSQPAHVRFWVELLNPTSATGAGPTFPAIGSGSVKLKDGTVQSYRILITKSGAAAATELAKPENVTGSFPGVNTEIVYNFTRIVPGAPPDIQPNNGLYDPQGNAAQGAVVYGPQVGPVGMGMTGPQSFEFNPKNTAAGPWATNMQEAPPAGAGNRQDALNYQVATVPQRTELRDATYKRHMVVLQRLANPHLTANDPTDPSFNPALTPNPYLSVDVVDWVPAFDAVNRAATQKTKPSPDEYVVQEKRFAVGKVQPYAAGTAPNQNAPNAGDGTVTTLPFPQTFVIGQGSVGTGTTVQHSFGRHNGRNPAAPTAQTYTAAPPMLNGGETLMAPYDWLVHLDRPLVNQLELLHLQGVKPHQVTQFTLQPPVAGGALRRGVGLAPWLGVQGAADPQPGVPATDPTTGTPVFNTTGANVRSNNGLYRALDSVRVRPWTYATGLGGRVHGRVNLNTVQDSRILLALLDPSDTGGGLGSGFTSAQVNALWAALVNPATLPPAPFPPVRTLNSRTLSNATDPAYPSTYPTVVVPVPGATVDDDPVSGTDRPFRALGGADLGANPGAVVSPAGIGLRDSLLRPDPATGQPIVYNAAQGDPYLKAEMVRKLLNNATTTSNVFAVHLTVAWFEVRVGPGGTWEEVAIIEGKDPNGNNLGRPRLGKEAYKDTPLDMRQQYFSVIDRSNCWLAPFVDPNPANNPVAATPASPLQVLATPFSSALNNRADPNPTPPPPGGATTTPITLPYDPAQTDATRMTVWADGQPVVIRPGNTLVLGAGASREVVVVADNTPTGGGTPFVQDPAGTWYANVFSPRTRQGVALRHEVGELVSNGIPGHPGPQVVGVVSTANSPHKAVVPFAQRVSR